MALKPAGTFTHLGRYLRPTKSDITVAVGERNMLFTGEQVRASRAIFLFFFPCKGAAA